MKRRQLLFHGLGLSLFAGRSFSAKDFWNAKAAAEWTDKERNQILHASPWAKEVSAQINMSGMEAPGGGGGPRGGGMGMPGGGPPGGMPGGGPPGGMPSGPGGMPEMKVTVRWESAKPVREAQRLSADAASNYVVSMNGLPMMGGGMRGPAGGAADADERLAQMQARLQQSTSLTVKGKAPLVPQAINMDASGKGAIVFLFPREDHPIKVQDKEVLFNTRIGPLEVKTRFPLKEMVYRGNLEI